MPRHPKPGGPGPHPISGPRPRRVPVPPPKRAPGRRHAGPPK